MTTAATTTTDNLNVLVLEGRLAIEPEVKTFDSGTRMARYLVTVRSEQPRRRVDVLPVVKWDPTDDDLAFNKGQRVYIVGSVQRRFWDEDEGRRSRIELVAEKIIDPTNEEETR